MNYAATYCALISKRIQHPLTNDGCYVERHHIIPKSEGGDNSSDNLVNLTAREHYIAHLLLAHIYNDQKMWCAIHTMIHGNKPFKDMKISSRQYDIIRRNHSQSMKGHYVSDETKSKIAKAHIGHFCQKTIDAMAQANKGHTRNRGRVWYNNGVEEVMLFDCPDGFVKGRLRNR